MTDEELIEKLAETMFQGSAYNARMLARAILPIIKAERIRGGEMVKEAAAGAYQTEAETWLQLPARGACSRLGAKAIRALSVPAIVEAGDGDL